MISAAQQAKNADYLIDQIAWDEAKKHLGPTATHSQIALLAQKIKMLYVDPPDPAKGLWDVLGGIFAWLAAWTATILIGAGIWRLFHK